MVTPTPTCCTLNDADVHRIAKNALKPAKLWGRKADRRQREFDSQLSRDGVQVAAPGVAKIELAHKHRFSGLDNQAAAHNAVT